LSLFAQYDARFDIVARSEREQFRRRHAAGKARYGLGYQQCPFCQCRRRNVAELAHPEISFSGARHP
jgi:hypothetical protein